MEERLQKLISAAGLCSRRASEGLIAAGRVTVNGISAALGQRADPERDDIRVDGAPLPAPAERVCLMLHKPRGYVSTARDQFGRPCVADLVRGAGRRLYPVGRLDYDSEGLLLMTDDGALAQALTHPSHRVDKVYRVRVAGNADDALPVLRGPMELDGRTVRAGAVTLLRPEELEITIHEGRNRQVRRMCEMAGLRVLRLVRVAEGPLRLGALPPGQWRPLTADERRALDSIAASKSKKP
ncbi:MAG: rRNA pseudouridine synthase [Oscillospiraceae bacterium]|nr:rRNA pseudouridine synthase [Oscillospiraceae bacterium]